MKNWMHKWKLQWPNSPEETETNRACVYDSEKCWKVALPSLSLSLLFCKLSLPISKWIQINYAYFDYSMHKIHLQRNSNLLLFISSPQLFFSSFSLSSILPSVNDCDCFRSVFIDLDKALLDPHCECAWCQSGKQSIWPSITAHWMKSALRYISPWNEAY